MYVNKASHTVPDVLPTYHLLPWWPVPAGVQVPVPVGPVPVVARAPSVLYVWYCTGIYITQSIPVRVYIRAIIMY